MTLISSFLLATLGTLAPAYVIQPATGVEFAALAVLAAVLFQFSHELLNGRALRR